MINMNAPNLQTALYDKPGHLIRRLQQIAVAVFLEETAGFDITPVQYAVLAAVGIHPGIDQLRVANAIGFDRTTIAGVVERLEGRGLLRRRTGPTDRRAKVLYLTDTGRQTIRDMADGVDRAQARMLEGLEAAEKLVFLGMLARLVRLNNDASRVPVSAPEERRPPARGEV